jgi:hypothetical protein
MRQIPSRISKKSALRKVRVRSMRCSPDIVSKLLVGAIESRYRVMSRKRRDLCHLFLTL